MLQTWNSGHQPESELSEQPLKPGFGDSGEKQDNSHVGTVLWKNWLLAAASDPTSNVCCSPSEKKREGVWGENKVKIVFLLKKNVIGL